MEEGFGAIVFLGLLIGGIWWHNNRVDYSKPWFSGIETVNACKAPYNSVDECYKLNVSSDGETLNTLYFNNGGYFNLTNVECVKAAESYSFDRFCRFIDNDGSRWDILPIGH